ncbi:hypothetical protein [Microcoleus sp. B9-D4]
MPIPQENLLFVEQASCLFLRMVQNLSYIGIIKPLWTPRIERKGRER